MQTENKCWEIISSGSQTIKEGQIWDKSITRQFFWVSVSEASGGIFYLIIIMRKTSKPVSCEILSGKFSESDSQQFESYQITGCISVVFLVVTIWIPVRAGRDNYLTDPSIRQTDLSLSTINHFSFSLSLFVALRYKFLSPRKWLISHHWKFLMCKFEIKHKALSKFPDL